MRAAPLVGVLLVPVVLALELLLAEPIVNAPTAAALA
jgi:hypothetical protein